ncbi:MAG: reverse transcriptase domain-containing protein [Candidatus Cloacimonetes bacterium]|nr:reverse transcriptase domain-containing protein [Candidatus Cloacimonadota bacterium]MDD4560680.1 reverse transcriptase domain-containing protein [Candidatus Cloacimonadota bacterium]
MQQAILNVIQPIIGPDFHPSSYGYRPRRSCQHAVAKAQQFLVRYDLSWAVDMDLSKCFDTLDHELITRIIRSRVRDPYARFCERDDAGFDHPASPYSIFDLQTETDGLPFAETVIRILPQNPICSFQ